MARRRSNSLTQPEMAKSTASLTLDNITTSNKQSKAGRRRNHSQPQPLTPAQPLEQVDTHLPLLIPPPHLCLKDSLLHLHNGDNDNASTELARSTSTTSLQSVRSDGSFHGDSGDEDPESQLDAGLALLKQQQSHDEPHPTATRVAESSDAAASWDSIAGETSDGELSKEIAAHAGLLGSLAASLFLGISLSKVAVPALKPASLTVDPEESDATVTLDTVSMSQARRVYGSRHPRDSIATHRHETADSSTCTLALLRDETRSSSAYHRQCQNHRRSLPLRTSSTSAASKPLKSWTSVLMTRSMSLHDLAGLPQLLDEATEAEDEDDEVLLPRRYFSALSHRPRRRRSHYNKSYEEDDDPEGLLSSASQHGDDEDEQDDDNNGMDSDDEADTSAYSTLFATPTHGLSRSASSAYNLNLLNDDHRSAFEEGALEPVWSVDRLAGSLPSRPSRSRTNKAKKRTSHSRRASPEETRRATHKDPLTNSNKWRATPLNTTTRTRSGQKTVSPLWDVTLDPLDG